jgi:hypothetical protein
MSKLEEIENRYKYVKPYGMIISLPSEDTDYLLSTVHKLKDAIDFNTSKMARKIFEDFLRERGTHPKSSIIHEIKNDLWIYQICCAVHKELYKALEEI